MLDFSKSRGQVLKKWKPFYATDFKSLMYPCFVFCNIFGIFPYKISASTFEISKPRYILSTVAICMVCVYEFIMFYNLWKMNFEDIPTALDINFYYILSSFINIVTYLLSGPRMRLLQAIMEVSSKLPSETYKKLSRLIHAKDIFGFFLVFVIMVLSNNELNMDLSLVLYTIYVSMVVFQMDMLYLNCVCILKACFKSINDSLANLREPVVKDVPLLLNRVYHKQGNPFLLMKLKALKKQHLMISDTVRMLNLVFSLQLLSTIIITFMEMTFSLYFYISQWREFAELNKSFYLLFVTYQFLKLSLVVWACETGKNQAHEIGTTIHTALNSISDEEVKNELKLFSLQILHRENKFSAKSLNVDATLLSAMIGNVTTYVLILIQFLLMLNSCDGNSTSKIARIN